MTIHCHISTNVLNGEFRRELRGHGETRGLGCPSSNKCGEKMEAGAVFQGRRKSLQWRIEGSWMSFKEEESPCNGELRGRGCPSTVLQPIGREDGDPGEG